MRCNSVRELAGPYLYGDLSPEEMRAIRTHAQQCAECRENLRTQTATLAAMPNAVPELTDEDRQRIAWSVKGAVRAAEPEARRSWFRFSPAYGLAAAVIVAMVAIKVMGSIAPAANSGPDAAKAKVNIVEVRGAQPRKPIEEKAPENRNIDQGEQTAQDTSSDRGLAARDVEPVGGGPSVRHRRTFQMPLAARDKRDRKPAPVVSEPPAAAVDAPEAPNMRMDDGEGKLPETNNENNAQTTPSSTDGTGSIE